MVSKLLRAFPWSIEHCKNGTGISICEAEGRMQMAPQFSKTVESVKNFCV